MIPDSQIFDQPTLARLLAHDALVQRYRQFFALLDWAALEQHQASRCAPGPCPHAETAYLKTFLIRICEEKRYMTHVRTFLVEHPLLVLEVGFHLMLDPTQPYGFDVERTLPSARWLREKLRRLDPIHLQDLLQATVHALQDEIPGLGEVVAFDVKHLYAWVRENNPRQYVKERYNPDIQPAGDPHCKLGVKRSTNQEQADGSTKEVKEYLWGYGSGVAAATLPPYGDVVLAEYTQPFNENDVTYYRPLYQRAVLALGFYPTHVTADAAFDAWYVYECAARHTGIAAVPLNQHGRPVFEREADGTPLCPRGLPMHPTYQFQHTYGYRAQRFRCPLLFPVRTGEVCDHVQFLKNTGCVKDVNWERGGQMRVTLDRDGPLYHSIYTQRTCCERSNSQAQALGIERPKVRNHRSVKHLNTLIYVVINVRALQRAKSINRRLLLRE
jgi:hypothetical protein